MCFYIWRKYLQARASLQLCSSLSYWFCWFVAHLTFIRKLHLDIAVLGLFDVELESSHLHNKAWTNSVKRSLSMCRFDYFLPAICYNIHAPLHLKAAVDLQWTQLYSCLSFFLQLSFCCAYPFSLASLSCRWLQSKLWKWKCFEDKQCTQRRYECLGWKSACGMREGKRSGWIRKVMSQIKEQCP